MVRARGGLDTFPSLVVEELRKAMPRLEPIGRSLIGMALASKASNGDKRAGTGVFSGPS